MDIKIRKHDVNLVLDEAGRVVLITARKIICENGGDAPADPSARARFFADPSNMYGTPLMIQFSFGQEGDPVTIADGVLAALGY